MRTDTNLLLLACYFSRLSDVYISDTLFVGLEKSRSLLKCPLTFQNSSDIVSYDIKEGYVQILTLSGLQFELIHLSIHGLTGMVHSFESCVCGEVNWTLSVYDVPLIS